MNYDLCIAGVIFYDVPLELLWILCIFIFLI